jgi:FkbM family methyltransferase
MTVAGTLRRAKAKVKEARFHPRVVTHRYAGDELRVRIATGYGERYDRDWPELGEIALLKRAGLREGATVFNLGANHGVIAMMLAKAVGPSGTVVAVEAGATDARAAQDNAALNGLDQLHCMHAAVARSDGVVRFGVNGEVDDGSGRFGREQVPAVSIDGLAGSYGVPDVVFMDVEGYEAEALAGAQATLAARPDWFVEVHGDEAIGRYGGSVDGVVSVFTERGYDCRWAQDMLGTTADDELVSLTTFKPVNGSVPQDRFFLIALGGRA